MRKLNLLFALLALCVAATGQNVVLNGYVFEEGNRGYLNQVSITVLNKETGALEGKAVSNLEGFFELELAANKNYVAQAFKQSFEPIELDFNTDNVTNGEKKFLKIQMVREPGYDFEVTLAPKRDSEDIPVDAIRGAWIEVYNNTTEEEVLNLKDHPELEFNVHFDKGNHYTVMIRKEGFFTKRMEAYVNVEGCILCFEGVGSIRPSVTDNLTEGNDMGVLLTNAELDPLFSGKSFEVQNIYYDFGKATLRPEAKGALVNLARILNDNPHIMVELGAHTDSRGKTEANLSLSKKRAEAAVKYLVNNLDVSRKSIISAGYGESRLSNKCSDGVNCSEEEHQENRRTEITVLNINDSNRERKTLKEIRVEEEFLRKIMADEVETKIEGKTAEPNKVVEETNEIKSDENKGNNRVPKVDPEEMKNRAQEIIEKKENSMKVSTSNNTKTVQVQQASIKPKIQSEGTVEQRSTSKQSGISKEEIDAERKKRKAEQEMLTIEKKTESSNSQIKSTVNTNMRSSTNSTSTSNRESFLLGNYTGYKIVIQFSRYPLNADHEVHKRHGDLVEYKASSGSYLYLIGDFDTKEAADAFLDDTVLMMYSGAYVIRFQDGRRMK